MHIYVRDDEVTMIGAEDEDPMDALVEGLKIIGDDHDDVCVATESPITDGNETGLGE
jgi:hypothetical protein